MTLPAIPQNEFYVNSIWMAAWLICLDHLPFLRCERGHSFPGNTGTIQTIFVFDDPQNKGPFWLKTFVTTNPQANIKKLRDVLAELRAQLIKVNNTPANRHVADSLSRLANPELTGGDDE
jgi:hypothetical protein